MIPRVLCGALCAVGVLLTRSGIHRIAASSDSGRAWVDHRRYAFDHVDDNIWCARIERQLLVVEECIEPTSAYLGGVLCSPGQATGKIMWGGWPVDKLGPRRTLWPSLLIMAALVFSLSLNPSAATIGLIGATTEFVATPVWPAHIQLVRWWWPAGEQSEGFQILGAASRSGDIGSKLLYMMLLSSTTWEHAARVGAAIAVAVSVCVFLLHADSPARRNERPDIQMTPAAVIAVLRQMACSRSFYQAVLANATLCIVKQTGERNLPLFLSDGLKLSVGASAGLA